MIIVGFALAFYIQLHNDYKGHEAGETFNEIQNLPIKVIAMAIGEFEYGDMPFRSMDQFLFLNRLTFILFVYFIALVMMNLLTGIAIDDVQEIKNASLDKTYNEMMWKVITLENGLNKSLIFKFVYDKYKVFTTEVDKKIRLFPNRCYHGTRAWKNRESKSEFVTQDAKIIWETSINENAKRIIKQKIDQMEQSIFYE